VTRRATFAGPLALASALGAITISPAFAASPNESYAALATGPISTRAAGMASFPGHSPVTLADANITGLLASGSVVDTADALAASSTVKLTAATLTTHATLTAGSISSSCGFDTNTDVVTGSATISGGAVDLPAGPITLPVEPAPNTIVAGLRGVGTVTLNAQSTAADGRLTVTAVRVSQAGGTQDLSLGVSTCNSAHLEPVPVLPGKPAAAVMAAAALTLAGNVFRLRRRRLAGLRAVPAAPDQAVHWNEPGDVAQAGDERDEEQGHGADAGGGDGPYVGCG